MAKGDIYHHSQFTFHDGTIGDKLFVILNEPEGDEPYLVVKTTSNLRNQTYQSGCNPNQKKFFIPRGSEPLFPLDTLIQLIEIFPFSKKELLDASMKDKIMTTIGILPIKTVAQIINCVRRLKEDISEQYFNMITR